MSSHAASVIYLLYSDAKRHMSSFVDGGYVTGSLIHILLSLGILRLMHGGTFGKIWKRARAEWGSADRYLKVM